MTIAILYLLSLLLATGVDAREAKGARRPPSPRAQSVLIQGSVVEDEHLIYQDPPVRILTIVDGAETMRLSHLWLPGKEIEVPVRELRLVTTKAVQSQYGVCAGIKAGKQGSARTRNRRFFHNPRIACAAFTSWCMAVCGRHGLSYAVSTQYAQVRKRGARLVATKVSTRYAPWYPYYKKGDLLFFWKSSRRMGHVEFCVGGGWTVGTSSSAGYVARRRIGNRGFRVMSVVRL